MENENNENNQNNISANNSLNTIQENIINQDFQASNNEENKSIDICDLNNTENKISTDINTSNYDYDNLDIDIIENNECKEIDITESNTSNCFALTIKDDYKLTSKTNRIIRSLRMSFKVFVSTLTLNIIKFFL